ncbi:MAG: restriction endonuclease [Ignavibacteriae bacterium]|nr:restriction endonuclease [Ignavibacteriota bacterium]
MSKIEEAKIMLDSLGLPEAQQNEISALTFLALCGIKPGTHWKLTQRKSLKVTKGIMAFIAEQYGKQYAPNTRETFRRQVLHQFVQAGIVDYNPDNPSLPVNSPNAHYALSESAMEVITTFGTRKWKTALKKFKANAGELKKKYVKERKLTQIPLVLANGKKLRLSPGRHNQVQVAIITLFAPRFAQQSKLLYLGDAAKKDLHLDSATLQELRIPIDQHSKLPDVVIYDSTKHWLYLIEAVTSHGPITPKRILELEKLLEQCTAGKIYVSAFPDFTEFKRHMSDLAWETEIWIVKHPDHMIHFNGDKFMGPRQ